MRNRSRMRYLALALSGSLGLALAGCGDDPSSESTTGALDGNGKTLTVLFGVNTVYAEEQQQWFTDIAAEFKEETGAKVVFETFASSSDELQKIQTSVVSGQGPDVYALGTTFTPLAASTGAFIPMGDAEWDKVGGKEQFNEATFAMAGPSADKLTAVPFTSRPFVMAYNTEMFKAAGIEAPPTTWDEFAADAKKLTNGTTYGAAVGYADNYDPWKFVWAMSMEAGNPIVEDGKAVFDDPAVAKAYRTYFDWITTDKVVPPEAIGWTNAQALAAFSEGKTAMLPITTATSKSTLDASPIKDSYAYALMPTVAPGMTKLPADGKAAASIISGDNLVVADYSSNKDLALAFVKLLTSEKTQLDYYKRFGDLPVNQAALAQVTDGNAALEPVTEAATKSVGTPFVGSWSEIQLSLTNIAAQAQPNLAAGSVPDSYINDELTKSAKAAQEALDRESAAK